MAKSINSTKESNKDHLIQHLNVSKGFSTIHINGYDHSVIFR